MGRDLSKGSSLGFYPEDDITDERLVALLAGLELAELAPLLYGLRGIPKDVTLSGRWSGPALQAEVASWVRNGRRSMTVRRQAWTWAGQALDERLRR